MIVKSWFVLLCVLLAGGAYYVIEVNPGCLDSLTRLVRGGKPVEQALYRWVDEQGRVTYGTVVPAGRHGERLDAGARMSVVPATAAQTKPAVPASGQAIDPGEVKRKMVDRAVEGNR